MTTLTLMAFGYAIAAITLAVLLLLTDTTIGMAVVTAFAVAGVALVLLALVAGGVELAQRVSRTR